MRKFWKGGLFSSRSQGNKKLAKFHPLNVEPTLHVLCDQRLTDRSLCTESKHAWICSFLSRDHEPRSAWAASYSRPSFKRFGLRSLLSLWHTDQIASLEAKPGLRSSWQSKYHSCYMPLSSQHTRGCFALCSFALTCSLEHPHPHWRWSCQYTGKQESVLKWIARYWKSPYRYAPACLWQALRQLSILGACL